MYNYFSRNWRMRVSVLADLPGCSIATTSTYMTKLGRLMKLELMAKVISKTNFRDGFSTLRRNNYLLMKMEHRIFKETMVCLCFLLS